MSVMTGKAVLAAVPTYSTTERDRRWQLGQRLMDEEDVAALIVYGDREGSNPAPFAPDTFFTNDRPGSTVVFPRHGEPIALVSLPMAVADHMVARRRHEGVWIRPANMFAGRNGATLLEILKKEGLGNSSIGVLGLEPYPPYYFDGAMPYNTWKTVLNGLPGATFKPVGKRFYELTASRSEEELQLVRWAAQVGEWMCEAMLEATYPGASERDIHAAVLAECAKHGGTASMILLGSGSGYLGWGPPTWTYRPHEPRVIKDGEIVAAEIFSSAGMLETQQQPTIAVGEVHPDLHEAAQVARESYEIGLDELQPGSRFGDVVTAMETPVRKAGGWHIHPFIHALNPFGPVSGCVGPSRMPGAARYGRVGRIPTVMGEVILRPGMTFAVEANCVIGRHLANLGGTVLVGERGPIELNQICTRLMRR